MRSRRTKGILGGFPFWRFGLVLLLIAGLTLFQRCAHAQASPVAPPFASPTSTGLHLTPGTLNQVGSSFRTFAANPGGAAGEVLVKDAIRASVGSANADVFASRILTWDAVATVASRALPAVAVGTAIYLAFEAVRCHADTGSYLCDAGTPQESQTVYTVREGGLTVFGTGNDVQGTGVSPTAAMTDMTSHCSQANGGGFTYSCSPGTCTGVTCTHSRDTDRADGSFHNTTTISSSASQSTQLVCTHGGGLGRDGLCPSGTLIPQTADQVANRENVWGDKALAPVLVPAAIPYVDLSPYALPGPATGPSSVAGPVSTTTTTNPDGSPGPSTTTQPGYDLTYPSPDTVTVVPKTVTTNPDGTTTTKTGSDAEVCGLPGHPECNVKVDETGTPDAPVKNPQADVDAVAQATKDFIADPAGKTGVAFPTISWAFSFPTGCATVPTPAFAPYMTALDVCQFKPFFDDLMGMIWIGGALFGAIGIFWRDQLSTP